MPATTGIKAARATTRAIVPSKALITREAKKAVQRFTPSHTQRLLAVLQTLPKKAVNFTTER